VTIGGGCDDRLCPDIAAGARLVFDDEGLAEPVGEALAEQPRQPVGGPARRLGHHPFHVTRGIGGIPGRKGAWRGEHGCRSGRSLKEMSLGDHHALQFTSRRKRGKGTRAARPDNWLCYRKDCETAHADPTGLVKDD